MKKCLLSNKIQQRTKNHSLRFHCWCFYRRIYSQSLSVAEVKCSNSPVSSNSLRISSFSGLPVTSLSPYTSSADSLAGHTFFRCICHRLPTYLKYSATELCTHAFPGKRREIGLNHFTFSWRLWTWYSTYDLSFLQPWQRLCPTQESYVTIKSSKSTNNISRQCLHFCKGYVSNYLNQICTPAVWGMLPPLWLMATEKSQGERAGAIPLVQYLTWQQDFIHYLPEARQPNLFSTEGLSRQRRSLL